MSMLLLPFAARYILLTLAIVGTVAFAALMALMPAWWWPLWLATAFCASFAALGLWDLFQTRHAILRNYPIAAHLRFILEDIRPEMRQYFFEGDKDGTPFPRDKRAIVYQRAKQALDKRPFGTQYDVYETEYEWLHHSLTPKDQSELEPRVFVGGRDCGQPYLASILNISAMSYGSLSANAVLALNRGAKLGGFAHDTGEGGVSPYHLAYGGDLIWEIGSGYFGAREKDGRFSAERFAETAAQPEVKMVELKLSQGAKPGYGGVLPAAKITKEVARIRGIEQGKDCISPARYDAFSTPIELMRFIADLRRLSGGKPTGFKLCIGHPWEFMAIIKAMLETGIKPDFIVIDGKEGGTGAAPLEFMDHLGMPLRDGLAFAHSALVGTNLRDEIKLAASGKIATAFDMARAMALGADWCNAARAFMFAVGCIQARSCHTGCCPTGVTSTDPARSRGVVVSDKSERVASFHRETVNSLIELVAAAGLTAPSEFGPHHFMRRAAPDRVVSFADQYRFMRPGELIAGTDHHMFVQAWRMARADSFEPDRDGLARATVAAAAAQ